MMTTRRPDVKDDDQFYTAAACRVLGICYNTLAKYDALGYIDSMMRNGRKVYSGKQIKRCYDSISLL